MGEISMSGSTRERGAAVIGLRTFHPAALLSTLPVNIPVLDFGLGIPKQSAAHRPRRFLRFISTFSFQLSAFASVRTPTPCLGKTSFITLKPGRRRGNF